MKVLVRPMALCPRPCSRRGAIDFITQTVEIDRAAGQVPGLRAAALRAGLDEYVA
jgi:hypothetical protein